MKRIFWFLSIAAAALSIASCIQPEVPDVNNLTEDGFYVALDPTGKTAVTEKEMMANGINEADNQSPRDGMYEKYIVLEANTEFSLAYISGGKMTLYGATLSEFKPAELTGIYDSNPADAVFKGKLEIGDSAPKMKVSQKGLYHIVLDLNKKGDLDEAQIVLCPVTMGVRGGMNSWGFTALNATEPSNEGITYTLSGQKLADGGEFKFAYNSAWKITLDAEGAVKANTNLGKDCKPGGDNIAVTEGAGTYKITLNYKLAAGDIAKSFSYSIEQESKSETPTTMNMIGQDFGGWDWSNSGVAELVPVWGKEGAFWCTRYFTTNGFKFCALKEWNGDFTGLGNDDGYTVADGNCFVPAEGFYTVYINLLDKVVEIKPAEVYGIGDAWGANAWDFNAEDPVKFVAEGNKMVATVTNNSSAVRLASKVQPNVKVEGCVDAGWFDWWKTEFVYFDGKIAYRGAGNDQDRVAVEAGKKIIIDFNAGTVEVADGGPKWAIDGNFDEWGSIAPIVGEGAVKCFKMNTGDNMLYFYLECNKDQMIVNSAMAYAHKAYFTFQNGSEKFAQDVWLMRDGQAKPKIWIDGFAGAGAIEGDVIKFEICFPPANDIFKGAGYFYSVYVDSQNCDTSSGAEVWGGSTDAIGQAPVAGAELPAVGTPDPIPAALKAEWLFTADAMAAYAANFGGTDGVKDKAAGDGGMFVDSNVSAGGRITYVQVDKTELDVDGKASRITGGTGHPYVTGPWIGDYWLFSLSNGNDLPAGTQAHISFITRVSKTGPKYWVLEYNDGNEWKPAVELQTAEGVEHNLVMANDGSTNISVDCTFTLAASASTVYFRMRCVSMLQANDKGALEKPNGGTCRIAGAEGTSPIFEIL